MSRKIKQTPVTNRTPIVPFPKQKLLHVTDTLHQKTHAKQNDTRYIPTGPERRLRVVRPARRAS